MGLIGHLLRKDIRRLWRQAAVALCLLSGVTYFDAQRADAVPGSIEGWMNVILPFAWACLMALVVLDDPLVGDNHFWMTLPCTWHSLLAAKALFCVAFVQIPIFLSACAILVLRGFNPVSFLPQLFSHQLLWMGFCLIAAAVAALVRSLEQFLLIAVVVAAAVVWVNGGMGRFPWLPAEPFRDVLSLTLLVSGAIAAVLLQYRLRRTGLSRVIASCAALAATMSYAWLPDSIASAVRCAMSPTAASVSLRFPLGEPAPPAIGFLATPGAVSLAIPVEVAGLPPSAFVRLGQLDLTMQAANGSRLEMRRRAEPIENSIEPYWYPFDAPRWQILRMDRRAYRRLETGSLQLNGKILVDVFQPGPSTSFAITSRQMVPGVGICSGIIAPGKRLGAEFLRIDCESPEQLPHRVLVRLTDKVTGQKWQASLGDSSTPMAYPRLTWLSPMHRRSTFFHITAQNSGREGSRWLLPAASAGRAEMEITPQVRSSCAVVPYQFPDIVPRRFLMPSPDDAN
ncbi:MAG: hypothetical protein HY820_17015 [Acidobacteria bacterium]|nr:hypothetical protein [Acidobacteriota bacterium]